MININVEPHIYSLHIFLLFIFNFIIGNLNSEYIYNNNKIIVLVLHKRFKLHSLLNFKTKQYNLPILFSYIFAQDYYHTSINRV